MTALTLASSPNSTLNESRLSAASSQLAGDSSRHLNRQLCTHWLQNTQRSAAYRITQRLAALSTVMSSMAPAGQSLTHRAQPVHLAGSHRSAPRSRGGGATRSRGYGTVVGRRRSPAHRSAHSVPSLMPSILSI